MNPFWLIYRRRAIRLMIRKYQFPPSFAVEFADSRLRPWFKIGYPLKLALYCELEE